MKKICRCLCLILLLFPSFVLSAKYDIKWTISKGTIVHEVTTTVVIDEAATQQGSRQGSQQSPQPNALQTITHSTVSDYPPDLLPEHLQEGGQAGAYQSVLARGVVLKRHHSIYHDAHGLCALAGTDSYLTSHMPSACVAELASHSISEPDDKAEQVEKNKKVGTASVDLLTHLHQAILLAGVVTVGQVMPLSLFSSFPSAEHDLSLAIAPVAFMPNMFPALSVIGYASNSINTLPEIKWIANGVQLTITTYSVSSYQGVIYPSCSFVITLASAIYNNQPGFQLTIEIGPQQFQTEAAAGEPVMTLTAFISESVMEALTGRTRAQAAQFIRSQGGTFDIHKMNIWKRSP